jgi:release factor glutamine methyltransferase
LSLEEFSKPLSSIYSNSEIEFLYRYLNKELNDMDWKEITNRLLKYEPLDYIVGHTYFYKHKILVNKNVLIPRPETEELIENIFNIYKDKHTFPKKIIEIGTGSGCISIVLKSLFPDAQIIAVDVSKEALEVAKQNATLNNYIIDFIELDFLNSKLWGGLDHDFDLIVSNPPYIPIAEKSTMLKNVLDFEPHVALFVEDTSPLLFYNKIFEFAKSHLTKNGHIFCETSENIQFLNHDFFNIKSLKDWSGNSRFIHATFI